MALAAFLEYFIAQRKINLLLSSFGFIMFISASILRNRAIIALGECYSPHIKITQNHTLIQRGPYKFIRHPIYLSIIIELLGAILIANAYYAMALGLLTYVPLLMMRLYYEEKMLIDKFGEQYQIYKDKVPLLLPLKLPPFL